MEGVVRQSRYNSLGWHRRGELGCAEQLLVVRGDYGINIPRRTIRQLDSVSIE